MEKGHWYHCFCCSVAKSWPTLCNPMDTRLPCPYHLPELAQTHVLWVSDAIHPSHPLSSPSPAFSLSQHPVFSKSWLFTSGSQDIGASASAPVLPGNIQGWFPLRLTDLLSLLSRGLSRVFSNTTVQKHQFFAAQPSLWSSSYLYATAGKAIALTRWTFVG